MINEYKKPSLNLTIVIVNYRSWSKLRKLLNSIKNQSKKTIVVDNNSNDHRINTFKKEFKWVKWIENSYNHGFSKGCNIGAKNIKSKWILFLNPDTIIQKDSLKTLIPYCELNPSFHLITIKQIDHNSKNTHPYGIFPNFLNLISIFRFLERLILKPKQQKKSLSKVRIGYPDWISGSFILIRDIHFKKLNGWDENFWMYCEDVDLSIRASKIKLNRVLLNDWSCIHFHGGSSRKNFKIKITCKAEVIISTQKYILKNFKPGYKIISIIWFLLLKFFGLLILTPFSKEKRHILLKLINYYKKNPLSFKT